MRINLSLDLDFHKNCESVVDAFHEFANALSRMIPKNAPIANVMEPGEELIIFSEAHAKDAPEKVHARVTIESAPFVTEPLGKAGGQITEDAPIAQLLRTITAALNKSEENETAPEGRKH